MIAKSIRGLSRYWQAGTIGALLLGLVAGISLPAPSAYAAATYSCGTYSSGAYSANTACGEPTGGSGTGGTVGAPNTGFAKLMEPANLMAIIGSLALLGAGIAIIIKSRGRKRHSISLDGRD
jgi:hypothetical protein